MIIVSGASGFIGGEIIQYLGDKARGLTRRSLSSSSKNYQIDLTDSHQTDNFIFQNRGQDIDAFIHCAGVTPWSNPSNNYSSDLLMAENVLKICSELSIEKLIFMSGWIVYDNLSPVPYTEGKTPLLPSTDYGKSKLSIEEYLKNNADSETHIINARLASIYGPGQTAVGLIPNLVNSMLQGKGMQLNSKSTKRDYYYIDDLAKTISRLTSMPIEEHLDINVGSGLSLSVSNIARIISSIGSELYGLNTEVSFSDPIVEGTPIDNALSIKLAQSFKSISNETNINIGLKRYVQWVKNANLF